MNDFVNPNKRSIQLPKGAKNLADVLEANRPSMLSSGRTPPSNGKCDYCGSSDFLVSFSVTYGTQGVVHEQVYGCCEECQRDLREFAASAEFQHFQDLHIEDDAAVEQWERRFADFEAREREFMRQKIIKRRSQ